MSIRKSSAKTSKVQGRGRPRVIGDGPTNATLSLADRSIGLRPEGYEKGRIRRALAIGIRRTRRRLWRRIKQRGRIFDAFTAKVVESFAEGHWATTDLEDRISINILPLVSHPYNVEHFMFFLFLIQAPLMQPALVHALPISLSDRCCHRGAHIRT